MVIFVATYAICQVFNHRSISRVSSLSCLALCCSGTICMLHGPKRYSPLLTSAASMVPCEFAETQFHQFLCIPNRRLTELSCEAIVTTCGVDLAHESHAWTSHPRT